MTEDRITAAAFFFVIVIVLLESLGQCVLPPTYSEYGEAPDYRD
jgi:hypothetical protein